MIPKIASALARVLDPIRAIQRPGQSVTLSKPHEGGEGGHGPLGYDARGQSKFEPQKSDEKNESEEQGETEPEKQSPKDKIQLGGLPLQSGLTQVILELNKRRNEHTSGGGVQSYETGAKEQKKNSRLPKGSMLDKKAG